MTNPKKPQVAPINAEFTPEEETALITYGHWLGQHILDNEGLPTTASTVKGLAVIAEQRGIELAEARAEIERLRTLAINEWANIPPEIVSIVTQLGPADWCATEPMTSTEHGQRMTESVQLTEQHFGVSGRREMQWLCVQGTDTVVAYVGTSPNSGVIARALAGAWNLLHEHCVAQTEAGAG